MDNSHKNAALMLKVYNLYIHDRFDTYEISKTLNISRPVISKVLLFVENISPSLKKNIELEKQRRASEAKKNKHILYFAI